MIHRYILLIVACASIGISAMADDVDSLGTIPTMIETSDVDSLAEQIKQLRGEIEKMNQLLRGEIEKLNHEISALKEKIVRMESLTADNKVLDDKAVDIPADKNLSDPNEQYQESYKFLKEKKRALAAKGFRSFVKQHPDHELAGSAYYWLGELEFSDGRYEQAAVEYMHGYKKNPKGTRAGDNLLKFGTSLGKINKRREACMSLFKLQKEFPSLPESRKKQLHEQLKLLSCE